MNEDYKGQNASFVKELRDRLLKTASFCSATTSVDLLTLESDARDKAISQVSLAWKEPAGWSTETQAMLDVLDGKEITASRITGDVTKFSYEARLRSKTLFLMTMAVMPFLIFGLGAGIYWTLVGFRKA